MGGPKPGDFERDNMDRIEEIQRRSDEAAHGPWTMESYCDGYSVYASGASGMGCISERAADGLTDSQMDHLVDTGVFIANAREDIPWLLDQLAAAKEQEGRLLDDANRDVVTIDRLKTALENIARGPLQSPKFELYVLQVAKRALTKK